MSVKSEFKAGEYLQRYSFDHSSYYDVRVVHDDPPTRYMDKTCPHVVEDHSYFSVQDKRSDKLENYGGTLCVPCRLILAFGPIDPTTGEPRV